MYYLFPAGYFGFTLAPFSRRNFTESSRLSLQRWKHRVAHADNTQHIHYVNTYSLSCSDRMRWINMSCSPSLNSKLFAMSLQDESFLENCLSEQQWFRGSTPFCAFDEVVGEGEVDHTGRRSLLFSERLANQTVAVLPHEHLHDVGATLHGCTVHCHQTLHTKEHAETRCSRAKCFYSC